MDILKDSILDYLTYPAFLSQYTSFSVGLDFSFVFLDTYLGTS